MMRNVNRALWILIAATLLCSLPVFAQKAVPLPELNSKRLLNELHITVVPTPNFGESMAIGLVLRYGASFDPAEKGGLANLATRMFLRATADKTAKGIQDELSNLGATIEVQADWDGIRFVMNGQSSKCERSLLLLYEVVAEAQFTDSDFNSVKTSILDELRKAPDPRQRIHYQFEKALFNGTTYGRPIEGDVRTVSAITPGDLRYFYRKFFSPSQASLVVVGNVSAPTVFQRAGRIWGVWVRNDDVPFTFPAPRNPAGRQIFLEDDPNSPAAQFIMGNLFPRREDPAFAGALLAAHIFQERMTKLLPTSLVTVGYDGRRLSSPFYVQGQAAADQTLDQLQKIREAAEGLKNTPVSEEELDSAQRKVIEDFNQDLGTTAGICRMVLDSELYRLGNNYAAIFPGQIRRCDPDTVKNAASTWIFPGGEILLVRGPAATLKSALETLGSAKQ
jgi:zinc protease